MYRLNQMIQASKDELFEILVAMVLSVVLLILAALVLWPLHSAELSLRLAKGCGLFWIVVVVTAVALARIQDAFRVDMYSHQNTYVNTNLAASGLLSMGWSAFAALAVRGFIGATVPTAGITVVLYGVIGLFSGLIGFLVVGALFQGQIYKIINLPVTFASFLLFGLWPAGGHALFGWFFNLFAGL